MVKDGYKETEIGVIPEDWEVKCAKNLMKIETGSRNTEHKSDNGKYLFFVRSQQVEHIDTYHYDCEAILTAGDGVGTGKVFHYVNGKFDAHQRVYIMSQFKEVSGRFFYNYFKENFGNEVVKYTAKSSVDSVRRDMIANMIVPVPKIEEQEKIAEALSDMDSLISSLEKLIEKKKAIKQACLQKMFPKDGETVPGMRLPGFTEAWEQRKLSEIATMHARIGWQNLRTSEFLDSGDYMLITGTDFIDGAVNFDTCHYVERERYEQDKHIQIRNGSILITKDGTLGKVAYIQGLTMPATLNAGVFNVEIKDENEVDNRYLFQYLKAPFLMDYVDKKATGGTIKHLNQNILVDFPVVLPHKAEQELIGEYFANLDRLITLHQRKLKKCRKIKEGMMQQLLTGKIRLISNADAVAENREVGTLRVSSRGHNHQFDDAVVIAGIVDEFYSDKYPLGRKKVQKLLYLFRRHQEADISAFKKKAAGPYADEVRYKGGEPIAISNKYICVKKNSKGSSFSKGEKIGNALTYLGNWNLNDDLKWLCERFKYTKTDRLELLATIDMAMCDLTDAGIDVTVENIKNLIKSHSEWKAKLSKDYFKNKDIAWAIGECERLFS